MQLLLFHPRSRCVLGDKSFPSRAVGGEVLGFIPGDVEGFEAADEGPAPGQSWTFSAAPTTRGDQSKRPLGDASVGHSDDMSS